MYKIVLGFALTLAFLFSRPYPHWKFQFVDYDGVYGEVIYEYQDLEVALAKFRADYPNMFLKRACKDYYFYNCGFEYPLEIGK